MARDSLASYVGHAPLLAYMAIGLGESREKVRAMLIEVRLSLTQKPLLLLPPPPSLPTNIKSLAWRCVAADARQKMVQPVGKPPEVQE